MKILVVSDSHGVLKNLRQAVEREQPDRIFNLWDLVSDAQRLSCAAPEIPLEAVVGNCDGWTRGAGSLLLEVEGVSFFLTHGHRYQVKSGLSLLTQAGREAGADVVCFGHTHQALCRRWPDGTLVVNPGSVGGIHAPATYAVVTVENGCAAAELKTLEGENGHAFDH